MRFQEDRLAKLGCSDGEQRDIHIWEPSAPKAVFIAIHGGMAHAGDYCTPALYFKERGYATVSYDMVGHNRQKKVTIHNFEQFLDDLSVFIEWTKETYPNLPIIMLGHSMGSLILTHYGLRRMRTADPLIKGFVMSSPYYANAIKLPAIMESMSGILSRLTPKLAVPIEDFTDQLTHDAAITARHHADAADDYRATAVSARFGAELLKAQQYLPNNISNWNHPAFFVIAGDDKLADAQETQRLISLIDSKYVTSHYYPENYHENFNETNREEIFALIEEWIKPKL